VTRALTTCRLLAPILVGVLLGPSLCVVGCRAPGHPMRDGSRSGLEASSDALRTALWCAIYYGDKDRAIALLKPPHDALIDQEIGPVGGGFTSCMYSASFTPLLLAVWQGNLDISRSLIERGADVNHVCSDAPRGFSALTCCVDVDSIPNRYAIASLLLSAGASTQQLYQGRSLLETSINHCDAEFVNLLLVSCHRNALTYKKPLLCCSCA
jgi:hypothetical protein